MRFFKENSHKPDAGLVMLAQAIETMQNEICDRLDILEGRLDELKQQTSSEPNGEIIAGHKPWTQRRDARVKRHFSVEQLINKLQAGGKTDA